MRVSLKVKLVAMVDGVLLIAMMLMGQLIYVNAKYFLEKEILSAISYLAENVAITVRDLAENEISKLRVLSQLEEMCDYDISVEDKNLCLYEVTKKDSDRYFQIAYVDLQGNMYVPSQKIMFNVSSQPFFQKSIKGESYAQNPTFVPEVNTDLLYFSVPVYDNTGKVMGVMCSVLKGDQITRDISALGFDDEIHPSVMDKGTGTSVASINQKSDMENGAVKDIQAGGLANALNAALRGEKGTAIFVDPYANQKIISAYQPVGGCTNWVTFCGASYDYYMGSIKMLQTAMMLVLFISLFVSSTIGFIVVNKLVKPLVTVKGAINEIASGSADLTKRMKVKSNDEIGEVVSGFNVFTGKLNDIMRDMKISKSTLLSAGNVLGETTATTSSNITEILACINSVQTQISAQASSVEETASAVTEIAYNIESLDKMINNQSTGVTEASAAVEQMICNIKSVDNSVDHVATSFKELSESAHSGAALQQGVSERIQKIDQQSKMLQDANLAIANIAEQTNLLAMNAAIEAAHAGESGKGFSVVADEIRKLSETSSQQSKTIGEQLTSIQEAISSVVDASVQSTAAFTEVSDKIKNTDQLVEEIRNAMSEQTAGSQQITQALTLMNDSTSQVRAASQEMAMGTKAIKEEVVHLQDVTSVMTESVNEMGISAKRINETGVELTSVSNQVTDTISEIGAQVDQFKVE